MMHVRCVIHRLRWSEDNRGFDGRASTSTTEPAVSAVSLSMPTHERMGSLATFKASVARHKMKDGQMARVWSTTLT